MFKKISGRLVAVAPLALGSVVAFAQDSAAVTAVNQAKTDGLAVAGALTAMVIAIWAALYIKSKFFGR